MRPPKDSIGIRYNGFIVELGDSIDVAMPDVEALESEGWEMENAPAGLDVPEDEVDDNG